MKRRLKEKKAPAKSPFQVLTTDQEELEFRRQRGSSEKLSIQFLDHPSYPFITYHVSSPTGCSYSVEIRSLSDTINSCSCPDFCVNTLNTCKHIEGVLNYLKRSEKKKFTTYLQQGSPYVEIYLDPNPSPKVSVAWPNHPLQPDLKKPIQSLFSANGTLLSPPLVGMSSIEYFLDKAPRGISDKVRISSHLINWINQLKQKETLNKSKEQFLEDVRAGKRSMEMVSVPLYPYQEEGMLHLAFQGRALLADEMGLGKTIQAIAACELLRRLHNIKRVLVVVPASLKGEWEEQIAQFTGLPTIIVRGPRGDRLEAYKQESLFYIVNYEQVRSDYAEIQQMINPDIIILDEAQRIKNWQTKTARAVKQLKSPYAFVLTGTPLENRIDEVYSIMQMVDPTILGPLFKFNRDYFTFNEKGKPTAYRNLTQLHERLKPVLLRRLKKDVEDQLPERTVNNFFVTMHPEQRKRYAEYEQRVSKLVHTLKHRPLTSEEQKKLQQYLACMRMLADTPYILDPNCDICPKLDELKEILSEIMEGNDNKIIIFSEWERMLSLVREYIKNELKIDFAWHTGSVAQVKRLEDIKRFKSDPACRFFLTTDAGSTGLNLQAANIVINLDLPWNPAKLEQRIARSWRKNQKKAVQVINLVCENSIEHRMLALLAQKKNLADGILDGIGDFDNMNLPSASIQMVKDLDLFGEGASGQSRYASKPSSEESEETLSPIEQMDQIKNQAVAHFNDRIHSLEVYQSPKTSQQTLLAVVDKIDPTIEPKMEEIAQAEQGAVNLELMDQQTYQMLKRLEEAGLITIHSNESQSLYRSENANRAYQTEVNQKVSEARKLLNEAERKIKMADVLNSGGFSIEGLPAAKEGMVLGLKSYLAWNKCSEPYGEFLLTNLERMCVEQANETVAKALIGQVMQKIQNYGEELTLFAMNHGLL